MKTQYKEVDEFNLKEGGLSLNYADKMIENCIGKISLPLGLGLNFKINNKDYRVPMVIEEPSVIAAASGAAKFIRDRGSGFITSSTSPVMVGQIQVLDIDPEQASQKVILFSQSIVEEANKYC
jgi:degradative hydroxymethylglutaryl-CoA reductase